MDADFTVLAGSPRRILMTCDTVGGVWRHTMDLSRALCLRGYNATLATMDLAYLAACDEIAMRVPRTSTSNPPALKACA